MVKRQATNKLSEPKDQSKQTAWEAGLNSREWGKKVGKTDKCKVKHDTLGYNLQNNTGNDWTKTSDHNTYSELSFWLIISWSSV